MTIPLIPTLVLSLVSLVSSTFVLLRIVLPILPPHPLSRKVPPSEFGLPNWRSLSPADKSHLWLASFDIIALTFFLWQAVVDNQTPSTKSFDAATDPFSAVRIWIALTLRQTCLLIVAIVALVHVRLGRSVWFGPYHVLIWAPVSAICLISTATAGLVAKFGVPSLWAGFVAYSTVVTMGSTVAFGSLVATLILIRRNLAASRETKSTWPPPEALPRPSFATEDVDALREGSSWITSHRSSRQNSISAFSFSTTNTKESRPASTPNPLTSVPSFLPKSSYWFSPPTPNMDTVPPVPPIPEHYKRPGSPTALTHDPDPFRRASIQRPSMDSFQNSWLTSPAGSQVALSAFSFPTTRSSSPVPPVSTLTQLNAPLLTEATTYSRPATPFAGNAPSVDPEKGISQLAVRSDRAVHITSLRIAGWMTLIWVPFVLSLPYMYTVFPGEAFSTIAPPMLLIISVTISSPLLAVNLILSSPFPVPHRLFPTKRLSGLTNVSSLHNSRPSMSAASCTTTKKGSGSFTVVEGRRSGDIWLEKRDAVEVKSRLGRALEMLHPNPKLILLPPAGGDDDFDSIGALTPPLPMQSPNTSDIIVPTPTASEKIEEPRTRKESKASSYYSGVDESVRYNSQILVAQRHYSTLATTINLPASPTEPAHTIGNNYTGPRLVQHHAHGRSHSTSSVSTANFPISEPPSSPLPPTPKRSPRHSRFHSESLNSSPGYSFGPISSQKEIDGLSAGVLPLLLPGVTVGDNIQVRQEWEGGVAGPKYVPRRSCKGARVPAMSEPTPAFTTSMHPLPTVSLPDSQSAPLRRRSSKHRRNHFSLPSLSLGKDGVHSLANWKADVDRALAESAAMLEEAVPRRNTVWGGETVTQQGNNHALNVVIEEDESSRRISATSSNFDLELHREIELEIARCSSRDSNGTFGPGLDDDGTYTPEMANAARSTTALIPRDVTPPVMRTKNFKSLNDTLSSGEEPEDILRPLSPRRNSSIKYITSTPHTHASTTSPHEYIEQESPVDPSQVSPWRALVFRKPIFAPKPVSNDKRLSKLRPLSLLQERDRNRSDVTQTTKSDSAKPEPIREDTTNVQKRENAEPLRPKFKKKPSKISVSADKENVDKRISIERAGIRPLSLARSATSKARGILRQQEVLPEVMIRPPSDNFPNEIRFTFR